MGDVVDTILFDAKAPTVMAALEEGRVYAEAVREKPRDHGLGGPTVTIFMALTTALSTDECG